MVTSFSWRCSQNCCCWFWWNHFLSIFKFHFACIVLFPRLQNSKTTQTSDWCFVCVQNLFVKMDFSSSKTISHRKFHSVRKFFTKDGVRSKHLSCIFAKVPGRYESFGRRLHFHHFETSLLVLLKCKHPKKWKRQTNGSKKVILALTSVLWENNEDKQRRWD